MAMNRFARGTKNCKGLVDAARLIITLKGGGASGRA